MNPTSEDGAVSDVTDTDAGVAAASASASAVTVSVVSVTPRPVPSSDAIFHVPVGGLGFDWGLDEEFC